jgi:hypothetical protein
MAIRVERRRPEKDGGDMSEHRGVRAVAIAAAKGVSTAANVSKSDATAERSTNREEMIREAAYFRAERRAFVAGGEFEDWIAAEREIDALLAGHDRLMEA